jgi:hypothetical protein
MSRWREEKCNRGAYVGGRLAELEQVLEPLQLLFLLPLVHGQIDGSDAVNVALQRVEPARDQVLHHCLVSW